MNRRKRLAVLALTGWPAMVGCTGVLVWATKEDASWEYVEAHCHGMTIAPASTSQTELSVQIHVQDVVNSSMCIYDARMRLAGNRILLAMKHGLCSGEKLPPLVASLPKPAPGDYAVVFDDRSADFPVIGTLHVD